MTNFTEERQRRRLSKFYT